MAGANAPVLIFPWRMISQSTKSTMANNPAARKKGLKPRANSANFAGCLVGLSVEDISVCKWKLGSVGVPAGQVVDGKRCANGFEGRMVFLASIIVIGNMAAGYALTDAGVLLKEELAAG